MTSTAIMTSKKISRFLKWVVTTTTIMFMAQTTLYPNLLTDAFLLATPCSFSKITLNDFSGSSSSSSSSSTLFAMKRGGKKSSSSSGNTKGGAAAAGARKNKPTNSATKNNKSAGNQSSTAPKLTTRAAQMNNPKKNKAQTPPWQVMSEKDRKKNIEAEKKRRELAKEQGIHNVKEEFEYKVSSSFLSPEDKAILAWKRFSQSPQDEIDFIGAYLEDQMPPRLGAPEVAFLGRSNVGKSSLLNRLVGSETARVGKTPGATASVNLYGIFRQQKALLGLVDLPGFGYAKLSKQVKESVQKAAETYLEQRQELMLGILLVDIRRVPSDDDRAVLAALFDMGTPIIVVATKVDKLSPRQAEDSLRVIRDGLGLPDGQPFSVSSVTGQGIKDLWRIIMEACEAGVDELNAKMEQGEDFILATPSEAFVDQDDIQYSQGFDWIHDSASIMYEDDEDYYEDTTEDEENFNEEVPDVNKESLKYLRRKAKDMEKRGEL